MVNAIATFFKLVLFCIVILAGTIFFLSNFEPPKNQTHQVVMYSLSTCGVCTMKRRQLEKEEIRFTEHFIDQDLDAGRRMGEKLAKAKIPGGAIGIPIFEINGKMLVSNPSLETIKEHF